MNAQTKSPRILRRPAVLEKTGLKISTQRNLEARGEFPKRIKLGERASGWLESEVDDWIASRVAKSRQQTQVA